MELIVAMAVMAVAMSVSLRLVFLNDRALQRESQGSTAAGAAALLLRDLGRDVMPASAAYASGGQLVLSSRGRTVSYTWSEEGHKTVREASGVAWGYEGFAPRWDREEYYGGRPEFALDGKMVRVDVHTSRGTTSTAFWMRN